MWRDFRFGARMLRKQPGFTVLSVLTLALGIGATAAVFSLIQRVLLSPPPYREPEKLVLVDSVRTDQELAQSPRGWAPLQTRHSEYELRRWLPAHWKRYRRRTSRSDCLFTCAANIPVWSRTYRPSDIDRSGYYVWLYCHVRLLGAGTARNHGRPSGGAALRMSLRLTPRIG